MLKYLITFLFCLVLQVLAGQQLDLKFEGLTIQDGLSSNTVNDIERDAQGFMWVATDDGVSRYDGVQFENYRYSEKDQFTLCGNRVTRLLINKNNELLVATSDGLNIYNSQLDRFERLHEGFEIRDIIEYSKGGYLLTTDQGLIWLSVDFLIQKKYQHDVTDSMSISTNSLSCLLEDSKGRLWVSSFNSGINLMLADGVFKNFSLANKNAAGEICYQMIEDHKQRVLAATYDNGVIYFNEMFEQFIELPVQSNSLSFNKAISIYEDEDHNLWVGTDGVGLTIYDDKTQRYEAYSHSIVSSRSITDNVVNVIFSDQRGGLWLGSHHRGINFVNKYTTNFKHREYIPSFENVNIVSAFKKDSKGNLWLSTDGGGIIYYDLVKRQTGIFEHNKRDSTSLSSNNSMALELDELGRLWVGTYNGGLDVYDTTTKVFTHYVHDPKDNKSLSHNVVWSLYRDSHNRMWVCTMEGLCLYQPETDDFIRFNTSNTNLKTNNIRTVLEIDSTHFYVGTEQGFTIFDLEKKSFRTFEHSKSDSTSISNSFILTINKDYKNQVWVGTYGGGLNLFDPKTETFKHWTVQDGLSNNYVCGVVPVEDGDLWVTTQNGLSRFNLEKNQFQNFHYNDGLQDEKFSIGAVLRWNEEKILIGGINGYNSFRPGFIETNRFAPSVRFTDFKLFNQSVDFTKKNQVLAKHIAYVDEIELAYDQNMITFHFAVLNYIQSEKNTASFYLEGVDKGWSHPENVNKANYTNLSPGEYVFHLRAANNHGVWSEEEQAVRIIISPPFWATWWFRSLVVLLILLVLYTIYKVRVKNVIRQKEELEIEVAHRTEIIHAKNIELEHKENRRIQSLNYAKLIQNAFLPLPAEINQEIKDLFILFQPSEIVSGDFYWMKKIDGKVIICAVDCTGHGVPGAFMSMMGNVLLDRIIELDGVTLPSEILERLHLGVVRSLHQQQTQNADGMDAAIVVIDAESKKLTYAGAMNPLLYFQDEQMKYVKATRRGIGGVDQFKEKAFEDHEIDISRETTFYIYSDGYQDQFGENGKKYMNKRFKNLLASIHQKPFEEQQQLLLKEHLSWRNNIEEQTDDILVIGGRV